MIATTITVSERYKPHIVAERISPEEDKNVGGATSTTTIAITGTSASNPDLESIRQLLNEVIVSAEDLSLAP